MNTRLHPAVGLADAVAAHQFDLQMVQRVEYGKRWRMERCSAASAINPAASGGTGPSRIPHRWRKASGV